RGCARVVVAHGDLPLATTLDDVAGDGASRLAVVVPDHRGDGTPVLAVPPDAPFSFAYGPGSLVRHCDEAPRIGLHLRGARIPELGFDVDVAADLEQLSSLRRGQTP